MKSLAYTLAVLVTLILAAAPSAAQDQPAPIKVVVTVAPLKALVEPLLPKGSELRILMQPGRSEHGYEFSPQDLSNLAGADLVVYIGLNLEPRVAEVLADHKGTAAQRVVCFAEAVGIQKPGEPLPEAEDHDHEGHVHTDECEHGHGPDQHLWLDPVLVKQLIPTLSGTVKEIAKSKGAGAAELERIDQAGVQLESRVQGVDRAWTEAFKALPGAAIVTHHNAFSRPAERYGFEVAAVIRTAEGKDPTPADIATVVKEIKARKVKAIFVEPQFNARAAERIARSAKVKLGTLDPLGDGDWFKLMAANLESITGNLAEGK